MGYQYSKLNDTPALSDGTSQVQKNIPKSHLMNKAKKKTHSIQSVIFLSPQTATVYPKDMHNKADEISVIPKFPKNFLITVILLSGVNEANHE